MPVCIAKMKKTVSAMAAAGMLTIVALPAWADDSAVATAPAAAATSSSTASGGGGSDTIYLQEIAAYTNSILTAVTTPSNPVLVMILNALLNLSSPDNSTSPPSPTPVLQNVFTSINNIASVQEPQLVTSNYASLQNDIFSSINQSALPNGNDLAYGTLLGTPPFSPDPRGSNAGTTAPYNYLKAASGMDLTHPVPGTDWKGNTYDQANYKNFYNTVMAVQTFNGYALSQLYADSVLQLTAKQSALITQVSDPTSWFGIVASEPMGAVVRQLLMFESQSYVVQTQILQATKLLLAAVAANNTLLMAGNTGNEAIMVMKAVKPMPKSSGR
jgi:hypothetical protein